jgi:hypothetical protein
LPKQLAEEDLGSLPLIAPNLHLLVWLSVQGGYSNRLTLFQTAGC